MDTLDLGTAGLSRYFGLDPGSAPAVKFARMSGMGVAGRYAQKRARSETGTRRGVVNNIVSTGTYVGDFKKTPISVRESAITKYGYRQEQEIYGSLSMNDVQYFTVQSVNVQMIARALASAFCRMVMWKHFKQTYSTTAEYLFPFNDIPTIQPQLFNVLLWNRGKYSDGTDSTTKIDLFGVTGITNLTTLDDFITRVQAYIVSDKSPAYFSNAYINLDAYQFVYRVATAADPPATAGYATSPRWSVAQQYVSVNVKQVVNIQNVTKGDAGGATKEYLDANPVVGRVFHLKGIYPDVEYQSNNVQEINNFAKRLSKFNPAHVTGIGVPDINPTGEWKAIPRPQVFANIMACQSGLRLQPGEIKKDFMVFNYSGKLNDLLRGLSYLGAGSGSATAESQPVYGQRKLGTCKVFAFEKVVPTGQDGVELNYHIDRYVNCLFNPSWKFVSSRAEMTVTKYDLKQGTVPVALVERVAEIDVPEGRDVDYLDV